MTTGSVWNQIKMGACICEPHVFSWDFKQPAGIWNKSCILQQRWTKATKLERVVDDDGLEINDCSDSLLSFRRNKLFQLASNVIDKVVFSEEASKIFTDALECLLEKNKSVMSGCDSQGDSEKNSSVQQPDFDEPLQVRAKGSGKRLKRRNRKSKGQCERQR